MLISEIENQIKNSHFARGLFGIKRCFGSHSTLGVVEAEGVVEYGTLAELEQAGLIAKGLTHLDPFFANVPRVSDFPYDTLDVHPRKFEKGPECPWETAEKIRAAAEARAKTKRYMSIEMNRLFTD